MTKSQKPEFHFYVPPEKRRIDGETWTYAGWACTKKLAKEIAEQIKDDRPLKPYHVRILPGNSSSGQRGYNLWKRKP